MSNRTLVEYLEPRNEFGPYWTLEVQRSAAGQPGLLFTITGKMYDEEKHPELTQQLTVVVKDGWEIVNPILEWLNKEAFE